MSVVTLVQRVLPLYRVPFFKKLASRLAKNNIDFKCLYGQESPGAVPKTIHLDEPWAVFSKNNYFHIAGQEIVWQKLPKKHLDVDLVIFEQANRLLSNYPLLFLSKPGRQLAYWGHGKDMQAIKGGIKIMFKKKLINKVNWWFAYTDVSKKEVAQSGFPNDRITIVNNTIDTASLQMALSQCSAEKVRSIYDQYGIPNKDFTCLYCGGLYPDKKLNFLINASIKVQAILPDFSLIIVGSGPESEKIQEETSRYKWLHYAGPQFGHNLAPFLKAARLLLMPGLVGLVLIDSFVAEVPLVTTDNKIHSPEIAYLENNKNGIITAFDEDSYSQKVVQLLIDSKQLKALQNGCKESSTHYTLDQMVSNFANGIERCLNEVDG